MPLSKPGKVFNVITLHSDLSLSPSFCHGYISIPHVLPFFFRFLASFGFFVSYLLMPLQSIILLPKPVRLLLHPFWSPLHSAHTSYTDHTRKIELICYLMSGYVNGKVLDTLSEHANALASTAVASLEDEADQLSHFPFLLESTDPVFTVPKHHGW